MTQVVETNTSTTSAKEIEGRAVTHIKAKILHILSIYPKLSPSMLQVGIGPAIAPDLWRPVLTMLVNSGMIKRDEVGNKTPTGRYVTSTVYSLTDVGLKAASILTGTGGDSTNNAKSNGANGAFESHRA